jgi:hypothetical protein
LIIAAAIRLGDATVSLPRPARHHDVLRAIRAVAPDADMHHPDQQGFLTDDGVFLGRVAAMEHVKFSNTDSSSIWRDPPRGDELFSENLW